MTSVLIKVFGTESEAKDYFAGVVQSAALHGAFVTQAGKLYLEGKPDPVVASDKWLVFTSGVEIVADGPPPGD